MPKFEIGSKVKVIAGRHQGKTGTVVDLRRILFLGCNYTVRLDDGKTRGILEAEITPAVQIGHA